MQAYQRCSGSADYGTDERLPIPLSFKTGHLQLHHNARNFSQRSWEDQSVRLNDGPCAGDHALNGCPFLLLNAPFTPHPPMFSLI